MDQNNHFRINISTNKRVIGKYNLHYFNNKNAYSTYKEHNFGGIISLRELRLDKFLYAIILMDYETFRGIFGPPTQLTRPIPPERLVCKKHTKPKIDVRYVVNANLRKMEYNTRY